MPDWWNSKPLAELNSREWESLCDGCAKCCLHKLEDEDSGEIYYTKVRCRYLDEAECRCTDYANRSILVPNCIQLDRDNVQDLDWLPVVMQENGVSHFQGIVERSRLTASLILDVTNQLENKKKEQTN